VSEWLRRWTRNPLASGRRGSNPLGVDLQSLRFSEGFYNVLARILQGFSMLYKDCTRLSIVFYKAFTRLLQGLHKVFTMCVTRFLRGVYKSVCSVAATYKPPMLVPRVRLPAGAFHLISPWTAARNTVFCKTFTMSFTQLLQCLLTRLSQ
jgi:hypothetical protein